MSQPDQAAPEIDANVLIQRLGKRIGELTAENEILRMQLEMAATAGAAGTSSGPSGG